MRTLLCSAAAFLFFMAIVALAFLAELIRTDSINPLGPDEP